LELVVVVKEELGVGEMCEVSGFSGRVYLDAAAGEAASGEARPGGLYAAIGAMYEARPIEEAMGDARIQAHNARAQAKDWVDGNMEGEGRQLGGMLVGGAGAGGGLVFGYTESEWGDHAVHESLEPLLGACRAVMRERASL
jgi:hypothetical protein